MIRYDVQVITPCTFDEEDNEYIADTWFQELKTMPFFGDYTSTRSP